ncbi:hypothetical protein ACPWSR_12535 [Alloiococcus sp. CFN-8]|uniref:hypothetical protein n=1 Tax=Alloiococcus sp. CFN-8 TaxID=3416081 RepID=UPI003CE995AB
MGLIIASAVLGFLGFMLGGIFGAEIFMFFFGIIGLLSPGLYTLEQIYKEMSK